MTLTATITDKDGDSASAALSIGQNLVFLDDIPIISSIQDAVVANTTGSVTGVIDLGYGADAGNQFSSPQVTVTTDAGNRTTNSGLVITGWDDLPSIVEILPPMAKR